MTFNSDRSFNGKLAFIALALLTACGLLAQSNQTDQTVVLADVDGFEDAETYPAGDLRAVTDGQASWQPADAPAKIVVLAEAPGKVLRRAQTGADNTDFLTFPATTQGPLTVSFDARVSAAEARTLDVFLLPASGGETSLLGWGTLPNKLCYYNGTAWIALRDLDTNWHRIEIISYLSGSNRSTWEVRVDGASAGTNLPWRYPQPAGTEFSRLRFGAIRGTAGTFADIDNLRITGERTTPAAFRLEQGGLSAGALRLRFPAETNLEYLLEKTSPVAPADWKPLAVVLGQGSNQTYAVSTTNTSEFFRAAKLSPPGYVDGYRGIWFTLGQFSEYGDKYSGGLGTYTANHIPVAIYSAVVNKTFFVYGGTIKSQRHLLIMASCYDHATGKVPRPTLVLDKQGVNDPHDNAAMAIDDQGYIWIFVSGRAKARPGWKFRGTQPYSVAQFELVRQDEMTYPEPRYIPGFGFFNLFTKYTKGRELYWETSTNGLAWSLHQKLAGIGGHYQVSNVREDGLIATFFNRHPGGNVDKRTDLYYAQTTNFGGTWTTADGTVLTVPLTTPDNPARVFDFAAQGRLMYNCDLAFDTKGRPVMLYIVSHHYQPGPAGDPRTWNVTRWTGSNWLNSVVCQSDHNYDMGSLYIRPDGWHIIAPTESGPQRWQAGGEMVMWSSRDEGQTWTKTRQITTNSVYNHTYARRPLNAHDPFYAFWADGDPTQVTPSRLYFGNSDGTKVWRLPYDMSEAWAVPEEVHQ